MKMTQSAKLLTGLGLMAGLFWGCQDLLSQKDGSAQDPDAIANDASALRLSIKDDSACRDQWNVILDARAQGLADTAVEKSFLADCVLEIKPGKDKLPPHIPPHLRPDSISRCRWIVYQIDGGRDSMTVSYKRYCPEDCDSLRAIDSTRHIHLCHEHPPKPPIDTTRPKPPQDSCKLFRARLAGLDTGSVEYKNLNMYLLLHCGKPPIPPVDTTKPPKPVDTLPKPIPPVDTLPKPIPVKPAPKCDDLRAKLLTLDPASEESKLLVESILQHCPVVEP